MTGAWRFVRSLSLVLGPMLADSRQPRHLYHYKLVVEVETPEGLRSGFAVREVRWSAGRQVTHEASTSTMEHRGEAVVVELPNGQSLFALMSPDGTETPMLAFGSARQTSQSDRAIKVLEPPYGGEAVYGKSGYPRMVRFRDINDSTTVEKVDPNNLNASFGEGYCLKGVTAQIVDEPLTANLDDKLPWLRGDSGNRLESIPSGGTTNPNFAQQMSFKDFARGMINEY